MRLKRIILSIGLAGVLGAVAFVGARLAIEGLPTHAGQPPQQKLSPDEIQQQIQSEKLAPRFKGELNGVFIAPQKTDWPADLQQKQIDLVAGGCEYVPLQRAGGVDLPREPAVPSGYVLSPAGVQVVACGGKVTGVNREYTLTAANGLPASVLIARSVATAWDFDVALDRVEATLVNGREAIVIHPISSDGTGQTSQIIFTEAFGVTFVNAFNLSDAELSEIGRVVADATK